METWTGRPLIAYVDSEPVISQYADARFHTRFIQFLANNGDHNPELNPDHRSELAAPRKVGDKLVVFSTMLSLTFDCSTTTVTKPQMFK